jgi:phenylalanyl-tRNA synthetase beta subunit
MKYSYNWLQRHIAEPLPQANELIEKIIFHAFEVEDIEHVSGDTIMDIKVLPDRAADCLSHAGMAREIAGLLNLSFVPAPLAAIPSTPLDIAIEVQSPLCDRYCAVRIDGVTVGPSPDWLKNTLESIGQKSINNIVDVTNLVLFDSGQPTHAFDAAKIDGAITIRLAKKEEQITTLSNEEKTLSESNLVIADDGGLLAIAGVKGGKKAEIGSDTTSIILEIAHFDAVSVRKTARSLNLLTDAAKRFENNLSIESVGPAAQQLIGLILKVAGGEVKGISDYYPSPLPERKITFTVKEIARLLGDAITADRVAGILSQYHYIYSIEGEEYEMVVPYWRPDLIAACNVAEEIGRVYGYEHIPAKALPFRPVTEENQTDTAIQKIKRYLSSQGYSEVMNYSFRKKGDVSIAYGAKDKSALRANLADGLKESYEMNRLNAALLDVTEVKLFEIGTVFATDHESVHVATVDKQGVQEYSVEEFSSKFASEFAAPIFPPLSQPIAPFKPWSVYPFITRDVAVWVSSDSQRESLRQLINAFASQHCVQPAALFDMFTKDGKTSLAYRLVFQSYEKTLTDEEVEKVFRTLLADIQSHNMEIR